MRPDVASNTETEVAFSLSEPRVFKMLQSEWQTSSPSHQASPIESDASIPVCRAVELEFRPILLGAVYLDPPVTSAICGERGSDSRACGP